MEELDPQAVALAKAIRQHETGNRQIKGASGELASRYQFLPGTWKAGAAKYLGNPNAPITLENENKVAYSQIKEWKDKGYNPGQIAAAWNAGEGSLQGDRWKTMRGRNAQGVNYDVPKYVSSVYANYEKLKPAQQQQAPQPQEGFLKSMAKSILKTPASIATSAYNVAKAAPEALASIGQQLVGDTAGAKESQARAEYELQKSRQVPLLGKTAPITTQYDTDAQRLKKTVGAGVELGSYAVGGGAAKTIIGGGLAKNVGRVGLGALEAGASGAMATGGQAAAEGKSAQEITSAAGTGLKFGALAGGAFGLAPVVAKAAAQGVKPLAKYGLTKALGVEGSTLSTTAKYGKEVRAARKQGLTREALGEKVQTAVDVIKKDISDVGRLYDPIRTLETNFVTIPPQKNLFKEVISKYGYDINEKTGKLIKSAESKPLSSGDIKSLEDFYSQYGKEKVLSANGFLNTREKLSKMADYQSPTRDTLDRIAADIREKYNEFGRPQLPGLQQVDADYAPLRQFFDKDIKQFVDKDRKVKLSKVMSALKNPNNKNKLVSLEKVAPGITKDFEILAAIEDIAVAGEKHKVGAYAQSILFGGGFIAGGPAGALATLIVTNPKIIFPILEHYSTTSAFFQKNLGSAIEKLKQGIKPNSIESKAISMALKLELKNKVIIAGALKQKQENDQASQKDAEALKQ